MATMVSRKFLKIFQIYMRSECVVAASSSNKFRRRHQALFVSFAAAMAADQQMVGNDVAMAEILEFACDSDLTVEQMRFYVNNTFEHYAGYSLLLEAGEEEASPRKEADADAQATEWITQSVHRVSEVIKSFVTTNVSRTISWIVAKVKEAVVAAIGPIWPQVEAAFSWVSSVFTRLETWISGFSSKLSTYFEFVEEACHLAMGLLSGTLVVALLERVLVAAGLVKAGRNLPMLFLGGAMAMLMGFSGLAHLMEKGTTTFQACGVAIMNFIASVSDQTFFFMKEEDSAEGQFGTATMLCNFAEMLSSLSAKTLIDSGRVMASFSQIKNGMGALKDVGKMVFETLYALADGVFGFQSKLLADLSVCVGQDVQTWLAECDAMNDQILLGHSLPRSILDNLRVLMGKGRGIREALLAQKEQRGTGTLLSVLGKALEKLQTNIAQLELMGFSSARKAPFCLFVTGGAGTGKTSVCQKLTGIWLKHNGLSTSDRYSRNTTDAFWSRYRRQAVVSYDDFGAIKNDISDECELIKVVSREPMSMNMPSLEEKGMCFDSRVVMISSNFIGPAPGSQLHDRDAYFRRRHMVVEVRRKEGTVYNPDRFWDSQEYILKNSFYPFNELQTFETFEDLQAFFLNAVEEHETKEGKFLDSIESTECSMSSFMGDLLQLASVMMLQVPQSLQKIVGENPGWAYLGVIKNELWLYNSGSVKRLPLSLPPADLKVCQQSLNKCSMNFMTILRMHPDKNPLVNFYCVEMVRGKWINEDLSPRAGLEIFQASVVEELEEWQKALIYAMSQCEQMESGYFVGLMTSWKDSVRSFFQKEFKEWPIGLKLLVGVGLACFVAPALLTTFKWLWSLGTGPAFAVAASSVFVAQSDAEDKAERSEYRYRNVQIRKRHWKGQGNFGDSELWLMDNCLANITFAGHHAQVAILPGSRIVGVAHVLRLIPDSIQVRVESAQGAYWIVWKKEFLQFHENSELATFTSRQVRATNSTVNDRIVWDHESLPSQMEIFFLSCKWDAQTGNFVPEVGGGKARIRAKKLSIDCGTYVVEVPKCVEYDCPTENMDCGSLVVATIGGKACVVGMHVAGTGRVGSACFIPQGREIAVAQSIFSSDFVGYDRIISVGESCKIVGQMKPEKVPIAHVKSSFVPTPVEYHLGKPITKEPSILTSKDERLLGKPFYDPYRCGMDKYAVVAGPFDHEVLETCMEEICETWFDASPGFDLSEVDMDVAINGCLGEEFMDPLVMSTSEGYPYVLDRNGRKGKYRYFEEQEDGKRTLLEGSPVAKDIEYFEECSKVAIPELVGIECPKDERLPLRKIHVEPKTRLFTILPLSYNLVVRAKFFNFVRFLMKRRDVLPCQVGVNPYSREWNGIANRLQVHGDTILCCDYSRFDGFMSAHLMEVIAKGIAKFCGGSDELYKQRVNLLMAANDRFGIAGKMVYRVQGGIPSGFPLTVIINSILNELLIRYFYRRSFVDRPLFSASFKNFVSMVCYGDDNLISVSPSITRWFNGTYLKEAMAECNIKITDGVDKTLPTLEFRELQSCDFLKRKFVKQGENWLGPLEKDSLWPQLMFVRTQSMSMLEAYITNCVSVLRELYLHSPEECKLVRDKMVAVVGNKDLPTFAQLEAFHEEQRNGNLHYKGALEVLIRPEWFVDNPLRKGYIELNDKIAICSNESIGRKHEDATLARCGYFGKYAGGNKDICISYLAGSGKGLFPRKDWMYVNFLRNKPPSELKKRLRAADKLLFSSDGDFTLALFFAVMHMLSEGMITRVDANALLTQGCYARGLNKIFDEYGEFFV